MQRPGLMIAVISGLIMWVICCLMLWWLYSLSSTVRVAEMACIMAALMVTARFMRRRSNQHRSSAKASWSLCGKTAFLLFAYGLVVMLWRQSWTQARGTNDDAMFLPILGTVNAPFFAETGWMIYFVELVPILTLLVGVLYFAELRLTSRWLPADHK